MKHFFWYRVTDWSPRPIGELLAGSYLALSNLLDRPLIGSCLAILWAIALAVAIGAAKLAKLSASVATALALFALSLLIAKPGEMFYWPMAATAYLPCWAAMLAVTLMLMGRGPILAVVLALVLMAWSFEAGAVAALVFCLGEIVLRSRGGERRETWLFSAAALCALMVCFVSLTHRFAHSVEVMDPSSGLAENWVKSALAAVPIFAKEIIDVSGLPVFWGVMIKASLLCLGPAGNRTPEGWMHRLFWSFALMIAAWFSVVAALHQFGNNYCCERLFTFRQEMILLALVNLGGLLFVFPKPMRMLLLTCLIAALFFLRLPALRHDYHIKPFIIADRAHNWQAGHTADQKMVFLIAPLGEIVNPNVFPVGTFRRSDAPWYVKDSIMERFHKQEIVFIQSPP